MGPILHKYAIKKHKIVRMLHLTSISMRVTNYQELIEALNEVEEILIVSTTRKNPSIIHLIELSLNAFWAFIKNKFVHYCANILKAKYIIRTLKYCPQVSSYPISTFKKPLIKLMNELYSFQLRKGYFKYIIYKE